MKSLVKIGIAALLCAACILLVNGKPAEGKHFDKTVKKVLDGVAVGYSCDCAALK